MASNITRKIARIKKPRIEVGPTSRRAITLRASAIPPKKLVNLIKKKTQSYIESHELPNFADVSIYLAPGLEKLKRRVEEKIRENLGMGFFALPTSSTSHSLVCALSLLTMLHSGIKLKFYGNPFIHAKNAQHILKEGKEEIVFITHGEIERGYTPLMSDEFNDVLKDAEGKIVIIDAASSSPSLLIEDIKERIKMLNDAAKGLIVLFGIKKVAGYSLEEHSLGYWPTSLDVLLFSKKLTSYFEGLMERDFDIPAIIDNSLGRTSFSLDSWALLLAILETIDFEVLGREGLKRIEEIRKRCHAYGDLNVLYWPLEELGINSEKVFAWNDNQLSLRYKGIEIRKIAFTNHRDKDDTIYLHIPWLNTLYTVDGRELDKEESIEIWATLINKMISEITES